ncbi:MAG: hypothetical protein ACRD6W_08310, partial [Nitrososphaerales archaeon]
NGRPIRVAEFEPGKLSKVWQVHNNGLVQVQKGNPEQQPALCATREVLTNCDSANQFDVGMGAGSVPVDVFCPQ